MDYVKYLQRNPVIVMDIVKYVVAALAFFLPVPAAVAVPVAGALLLVLTVATRATVTPNHKVPATVSEGPADGPEVLDADDAPTVTFPAV